MTLLQRNMADMRHWRQKLSRAGRGGGVGRGVQTEGSDLKDLSREPTETTEIHLF